VARSNSCPSGRQLLGAACILMLAACTGGQAADSWTSVDSVPGTVGATYLGVTAGQAGFVAVGSVPREGEPSHVGAWTSPDGRAWTPAADDPSFSDHVMDAVASGPAGYFAVGLSCSGECGGGAAWTSTDGKSWQLAAAIESTAAATPHLLSVAAGGPGWIVGGSTFGQTSSASDYAAAWVTVDGSSWTAATVKLGGGGSIGGLASNGSLIVAVGAVTPTSGHQAAVWTSTDGITWTRAKSEPSFANGVMDAVVFDGQEFVAVGLDDSGAAAWVSPDGTTWHKAPAAAGFAGARMTSIAGKSGSLTAVGYDSNGVLSWTSRDGQTWVQATAAPDMTGDQALGVAEHTGVVVTVGGSSGHPEIWTRGG
jgi:hypothetical protein